MFLKEIFIVNGWFNLISAACSLSTRMCTYVHVCVSKFRYLSIFNVTQIILIKIHESGTAVRACLHEGGGPQVGEVTRLSI